MSPSAVAEPVLPETEWKSRRDRESAEWEALLDLTFTHRKEGKAHPVWDFLWEYYSFRPGQFYPWSPGAGVVLAGAVPGVDLDPKFSESVDGGAMLTPRALAEGRRDGLQWLHDHLRATREASPRFSCFGLHEWAMLYRSRDRRHGSVPLRVSQEELDGFVESRDLCCSHYDAFRFFTPEARPRNQIELTAAVRSRFEQPGCLHANMDLYKWVGKFYPLLSARLLIDCFRLAVQARQLDMEASPYDFSGYGFSAVRIESQAGRAEYVKRQEEIAMEAAPLRDALIRAVGSLLDFH